MEAEQALKEKVRQLGRLTMKYETSVNLFPAENYLDAFYDYYEIRVRPHRLVPSPDSFRDTLREVSGYDVWEPIAEETESLFGTPSRVMIFDDDALFRVVKRFVKRRAVCSEGGTERTGRARAVFLRF